MLKKKIKERFPSQTFEYSCEYDGIDDSTGKQKVGLIFLVGIIFLVCEIRGLHVP